MPIVALTNFASAIIATATAFLIRQRLLTENREMTDVLMRDFFKAFVSLAILFWLLALPGLFIRNILLASIPPRLATGMVLLTSAYFISTPLLILNKGQVRKILQLTAICMGILFIVIDFYFFKLSSVKTYGDFFYYAPSQLIFVRAITGAASLLSALASGLFFIAHGTRLDSRQLKTRSLLLGSGFLLFTTSSIFNYIVFSISFNTVALIAASTSGLLGMVLLGIGVIAYHPSEKRLV
ncbi:MAG: hypothetical protein AAB783_00415 [Patescibacteria group bacterium]